MKNVKLSARLQALADMVSEDRIVCDVGCDHGFVSIYLVQKGISPKVYAMDVRIGPLERAKEHIAEYQLEKYIETRLSDGLEKLEVGEADSMVCAGMGGPLMIKILTEGKEKAQAMKELILQPQSEIAEFRKFLRENEYQIIREEMIYEEGKYYPMMKVIPGRNTKAVTVSKRELMLWDTYGEFLLKEKHPVLQQYLKQSKEHMEQLLHHLRKQAASMERITELQGEYELLLEACEYMKVIS